MGERSRAVYLYIVVYLLFGLLVTYAISFIAIPWLIHWVTGVTSDAIDAILSYSIFVVSVLNLVINMPIPSSSSTGRN